MVEQLLRSLFKRRPDAVLTSLRAHVHAPRIDFAYLLHDLIDLFVSKNCSVCDTLADAVEIVVFLENKMESGQDLRRDGSMHFL